MSSRGGDSILLNPAALGADDTGYGNVIISDIAFAAAGVAVLQDGAGVAGRGMCGE